MTPESQLIALLEFLGWKNIKRATRDALGRQWFGDHPEHGRCEVPRLTLDLMHEAEVKYLRECKVIDQQSLWLDWLGVVVGWEGAEDPKEAHFVCELNRATATKEQRLEALLRTLNKWVESEVAK